MSTNTSIEWTDVSWNPIRGCSRVSAGCDNCYAAAVAYRFSGRGKPYEKLATRRNGKPDWTGSLRLVPDLLDAPLGWRKPRRVFVNSMSDLFHPAVPDETIDRVFATMLRAPRHTYQVLTKRPKRMLAYMTRLRDTEIPIWLSPHELTSIGGGTPTRWLWLGVSVEDQATADERIPLLLQTPAAVRWISAEPLLGPIAFAQPDFSDRGHGPGWLVAGNASNGPALDWVVVGGESGPRARPCDVAWIRSIIESSKAAGVPCFVKQLGARPFTSPGPLPVPQSAESILRHGEYDPDPWEWKLRSRKGGDPAEWPEDLRVREFPR